MLEILEQYRHLIEKLVPRVMEPNFDSLFKEMTKDISKPHQFQIKLEINRLKQLDPRIVDLRGHVDGNVLPYKHQGKTHYLDSIATKVFEKEIAHYGDFTVGVYEKATNTENNYRVLHRKEQQERLAEKNRVADLKKQQGQLTHDVQEQIKESRNNTYHAHQVQFQSYAIRSEERMNYSISVELDLSSGDVIKATSSDLSVSGCKVKMPFNASIDVGEKLRMELKGLEEEFTLGLKEGIEYQVVGVDQVDDFKYVRMKRTYNKDISAFDDFLGNFIKGNKRRYKVNMDNTEAAVIIKGYEQYYAPRITTLPIFISQDNERLYVSSVLTTENNKSTLRYWLNNMRQPILPQLFNQNRLKKLLTGEQQTYLYSFTHVQKQRVYHYAILHQELENNQQLRHLFWGFGAHRDSWRVFKLHISKASYDSAHRPLSLPDAASEEIRNVNRPPSPRVQAVIGKTIAIIGMDDITEQSEHKLYKAFKFDRTIANKLKICCVNTAPPHKIEIIAVDYVNLRKETRFFYQTPVTLELPSSESFTGHTLDFSTKGIQVKLAQNCAFEKGNVVLTSLPELQKITRKFKLIRLPYEIMQISKCGKLINLRIYEQGDDHNGKKFFQQLIQTNHTKLTAAEDKQTIPGIAQAMRNIYISICPNMPFFIHRKGIHYMINIIGQGGQSNAMHQIMAHFKEDDYDYHLYPLIQDQMLNTLYANSIKAMTRQDLPITRELLIRIIRKEQDVERAVQVHYSGPLDELQDYQAFIDEAMENDLFFAFRVYISRTGRPDVNYIAKELQYIGNYAKHRAKLLEEELWGVIGIGDVIDITDEMLYRHGYQRQQIKWQQHVKRLYFSKKPINKISEMGFDQVANS